MNLQAHGVSVAFDVVKVEFVQAHVVRISAAVTHVAGVCITLLILSSA